MKFIIAILFLGGAAGSAHGVNGGGREVQDVCILKAKSMLQKSGGKATVEDIDKLYEELSGEYPMSEREKLWECFSIAKREVLQESKHRGSTKVN